MQISARTAIALARDLFPGSRVSVRSREVKAIYLNNDSEAIAFGATWSAVYDILLSIHSARQDAGDTRSVNSSIQP